MAVRYFDPFSCERTGRLHAFFATRRFRPYVAGGTFWQRLGLAQRTVWTRRTLDVYVRQSRLLELAHLASLVFLFGVAVFFAVDGRWIEVAAVTGLNALANFYPILVVRYNRHRIERRLANSG